MKKRILCVEDNQSDFKGLEYILKEANMDVELTRVGGVQEFWDAYVKGEWDLILLDVMLPAAETEAHIDIDAGIKIVQKLRQESNTTPVVVITSRWGSDPIWQAINGIGFVRDMVFKPIDESALCTAVRAALRAQGTARKRTPRKHKS